MVVKKSPIKIPIVEIVKFTADWTELTSAVSTLLITEVILATPRRASIPKEMFQLHSGMLRQYISEIKGKISFTLTFPSSLDRVIRIQELEEEKMQMIRDGASTQMMQMLFRMSRRQVQQIRERLNLHSDKGGRPKRRSNEVAYEVAGSWMLLQDTSMNVLKKLRRLKSLYPNYSLKSIYAVIRNL